MAGVDTSLAIVIVGCWPVQVCGGSASCIVILVLVLCMGSMESTVAVYSD